MLHKLKTRKSEGFTIIEVLIVLAIAGLILLIVFLAVPALQRNSRNTQRRNDVSALLSAVSEYANDHGGSLPTTGQFSTAFATTYPKLGYYTTKTNITWTKETAAAAPADPDDLDKVTVVNYSKCNTAGTAASADNATARSIIALFDVETSNGNTKQCVESGA